jgi:CheY-like chemotaxis protein
VRGVAEAARQRGARRTIVLVSPYERRDLGSPHAAGFDAYLVKPVRSRSLHAQLRPTLAGPAPVGVSVPVAIPVRRRALRVLLAEDNDVNALLAVKSLERLGALVDWAKDGAEALDFAEAALADERPRYDLILMDVRMPKLDGFTVTQRIREREAREMQAPCRIVALTASILRGDEPAGRAVGFDGFLAKPFTFEALQAQLPEEEVAQAS